MICRIFPLSGIIKPRLPAVEAWSLNHWTAREVPRDCLLMSLYLWNPTWKKAKYLEAGFNYTVFLFLFKYKQKAKLTQHSTPDWLSFLNQRVINLTNTDFRISDNLLPSPAAHLDGQALTAKQLLWRFFQYCSLKDPQRDRHTVTSLRHWGLVDMPGPGCFGETEPWKHMPVGAFTHNSVLRLTKAEAINLSFVFNLP